MKQQQSRKVQTRRMDWKKDHLTIRCQQEIHFTSQKIYRLKAKG